MYGSCSHVEEVECEGVSGSAVQDRLWCNLAAGIMGQCFALFGLKQVNVGQWELLLPSCFLESFRPTVKLDLVQLLSSFIKVLVEILSNFMPLLVHPLSGLNPVLFQL